jgi:hypothetical protein
METYETMVSEYRWFLLNPAGHICEGYEFKSDAWEALNGAPSAYTPKTVISRKAAMQNPDFGLAAFLSACGVSPDLFAVGTKRLRKREQESRDSTWGVYGDGEAVL